MPLRCLLVDDSAEFVTSASTLLTLEGVLVVGHAATAVAALDLVRDLAPDVTLVDVELGPDDGIELAARLAAAGLGGCIILISQRDRSEIGEPGLTGPGGPAGFVRKDALNARAIRELVDREPPRTAPPVQREGLRPDPGRQLAALRRVASVVAQGADPQSVYRRVAHEASEVLGIEAVSVIQYHAVNRTLTKLYGTHGERSAVVDGSTWPIEVAPDALLVVETGSAVRIDSWDANPDEPDDEHNAIADRHNAMGFGGSIAAPVMVDGGIWGWLGAYGRAGEILAPNAEHDLADFTNLLATAIANVQVRGLAEAQGALRRVATLVAQGAEPQAVFAAVATEASGLLGVGAVSLIRYDAATRSLTKLYGTHGRRSPVPDGATWPLANSPEAALVVQTGGPARIDDWSAVQGPTAEGHRAQGFGGSVSAPIMVDGAIWGILAAYAQAHEVLPPDSARDLADFTVLIGSAIANAQARDELRGLAQRQGEALRRVATLVARRAPSGAIFDAVAAEAHRALSVTGVEVCRFANDGRILAVGSTARRPGPAGLEASGPAEQAARAVRASGQTHRLEQPPGPLGLPGHVGSVVAAPIHVDGGIWGVIVTFDDRPVAPGFETRLTDFTHLVASSIANVNARDGLIASRARVVSAGDDTRRRIERNLHDGVQQRMVALELKVRAVPIRSALAPQVQEDLDEITRDLEGIQEEIRVLSQGLHPVLLARYGLAPALRDLVRRSPMIVDLQLRVARRFAEPLETAIYYVVSEALTNAGKHAGASTISVLVRADDTVITADITDDGVGGATAAGGTGLIGLVDRIEAIGGRLTVTSPPGQGTTISLQVPLEDRC